MKFILIMHDNAFKTPRYWPTINSTLPGNSFKYYNTSTESIQQIKTYGPGIKLTPWIVNVSIGYSFEFKKKQS